MAMAKALLKTGETIELLFEEMLNFLVYTSELVQAQLFEKPLPPRRSQQNPVENATK